MIHFRLRRSIRRAVRFLTLRFTGLSALSRPHSIALRDYPKSFPLSSPSVAFKPISAWHSRPDSVPTATVFSPEAPRQPTFQHRCNLRTRRHLSSLGLAIALLLQLCGCNPVKNIALASDPSSGGEATGEFPSAEKPLSFYDPAESSSVSTLTIASLPKNPRSISAEPKPLPWAFPESVYLLYKSQPHSGTSSDFRLHQLPVATAFVLSVPSHRQSRPVRFLVTARHVVDPQWAHCAASGPDSIDVRLNRRSGGVDYESIPLHSGSTRNFYTPADTTADLAVIPLNRTLIPNIDGYKFIDVPFRLLPTEAETRLVRPGQAVMTAGLSPLPFAESGSYPVFDAGSLSKMPAEPVGVLCGMSQNPGTSAKLLHVWFINAGVPQGVSGAPVYTSITRGTGAAKSPVLLGIQSVDWPDNGVAGITPSAVLADLVQSALNQRRLDLDFYRGPNP